MRALYLTAAGITALNILYTLRLFFTEPDGAAFFLLACAGYYAVALALADGWRARRAIASAPEIKPDGRQEGPR